MSLRPDILLAHDFGEAAQSCAPCDAIVYALALGIGGDPLDDVGLAFLDETRCISTLVSRTRLAPIARSCTVSEATGPRGSPSGALGRHPADMTALACFTGIVLRGDLLEFAIWADGAAARFRARVGKRIVLDEGKIKWSPHK